MKSVRKRKSAGYAFEKRDGGWEFGKRKKRRNGYGKGRGGVPMVIVQQSPAPELKVHDLDVDDATIAANGTIAEDSVLTIPEGVGEEQRIGRKITVKKIGWKFNIKLPAGTTATASDTVRVMLYVDKQTNGAAAAVTDLLATDDFQSFNNLSNKSRFYTLMDRTYDVNTSISGNGTSSDTVEKQINDSFYKDCNLPIEYDNSATTGAITTMRSNNIGVLLLSESGLCAFQSKMRIRYVDY